MSFPCVPSEAVVAGRESRQPGSLDQRWLLCVLFLQLERVNSALFPSYGLFTTSGL